MIGSSHKEETLNSRKYFISLLILIVTLTFAGCKKKEIPAPEPTPSTPSETSTPSGGEQPRDVQQTPGEMVEADLFDECTKQLQPVFFDYNMSDIRDDQIPALQNNARVLKAGECGTVTVLIEGHCDERGTDEYNLALGERRADAAKDYIVSLGIPDGRLTTLSYGESRPFAQGHDDESWAQNRRAHFVAVRK